MEFLEEVVFDGLLDLLKLLPFLFLTYLLMEFIEHKASDKVQSFITGAGRLGPLIGGCVGAVPQCGFSAMAANLYTGRVITAGTLIAVFLSTSDEMLPVMISEGVGAVRILILLGIKAVTGILVGFLVDLVVRRRGDQPGIAIDELCEHDHCHCERGVLHSALHHTVSIGLFLLLITLLLNTGVYFVGEERLSGIFGTRPWLSLLISALIGLIPNCAASVLLTKCYVDGLISAGALLAGLLPGAGVGMLVLFRVNRHPKTNLLLLGVLFVTGLLVGGIADLTGLSSLF